jgi:hypothetical protein
MALKERIYTNDEFWAFTDLPENADKFRSYAVEQKVLNLET